MEKKLDLKVYSFEPIDARMYVLLKNKNALIIDPCVSNKALQEMKQKAVENILVLLTHEHYDHISGVNWLRKQFENVKIICEKQCAEAITNSHKNISAYSNALYMDKAMDKTLEEYGWDLDYSCTADEYFEDVLELDWENHQFLLKKTPGHSKGSICIVMDNNYLFSGDSLVTGHKTVTRLPGGSKKDFQDITIPFLKDLNPELLVYPGHGNPQRLKEYNL